VLDPFGMAPGVPELVWDPMAGCVDPMVAERRAKAFSAGTVTGAVAGGRQDGAARFYAAETTNTIVVFGGGKDIHFYREVSDLLGTTRISQQSISDGPGGIGTNRSVEDVPVLRPEHIRLIPERQALIVAENAPPSPATAASTDSPSAGRKHQGLPAAVFSTTGPARLVLITCGGPFNAAARSYQDNIVVFAATQP